MMNLDLNMGDMSIPLSEHLRNFLTLIMSFRLFECLMPPQIEYYENSQSLGADDLSRIEQDDNQITKCKFELCAIQALLQKNNDYCSLHL